MTENTDILEHELVDGIHVLRLKTKRLDISSPVMILEDVLEGIVEESGVPRVVLNLESVQFLVTTALAKLVRGREGIREAGGILILCELQGPVREVMDVTGFDELFEIYETEESAVQGAEKHKA
ncbi:MAG: STAS domain-containing protein [Planctomycetota bacterium]